MSGNDRRRLSNRTELQQKQRRIFYSRLDRKEVQTREIFVRLTLLNLDALTNSCVAYREPNFLGVLQAYTVPEGSVSVVDRFH